MKRKLCTYGVALAVTASMLLSFGSFGAESFEVISPGEGVSFHTQLQDEAIAAGAEHISEYSDLGKTELSIPAGIPISWTYAGEAPETFVVSVSTNEDMSEAAVYEVPGEAGENRYNIQNLLLDTTYYFTVSAGDEVSDIVSFSTAAQGPRNLYVDGITNVRDLGNWITNDGGKIRQGLVFRCGQLNTDETTDPCITQEGIDTMRNALGVKTEIDFRRTEDNEQGGITESPLGSDIQYYSEPIGYITDVTPDVPSIVETFRVLADKDNYPIIYHCKIGTDRTGFITYLILSLCDVQMDDIYLDYAFSNLGFIQGKRNPNRLDKMVSDNLEAYMGSTAQETARNYLASIGITEEEMNAIVEILVEK